MIDLLTRLDSFDSISFMTRLLDPQSPLHNHQKQKHDFSTKNHHHKISNSKQKTQTDDDDDNNITLFFAVGLHAIINI